MMMASCVNKVMRNRERAGWSLLKKNQEIKTVRPIEKSADHTRLLRLFFQTKDQQTSRKIFKVL